MELLPGESIILESEGADRFVLTSHRIQHQYQRWGSGGITSIMLDELASCVFMRFSRPMLLVGAAIALVGGILIEANDGGSTAAMGLFISLVLVGFYFATRKHILFLASAGSSIQVHVREMNMTRVREMIDQIEAAKNARYLLHSPHTHDG